MGMMIAMVAGFIVGRVLDTYQNREGGDASGDASE